MPAGGLAVVEDGMAVIEGAALNIVAAQSDRIGPQIQPRCCLCIFACMPQQSLSCTDCCSNIKRPAQATCFIHTGQAAMKMGSICMRVIMPA